MHDPNLPADEQPKRGAVRRFLSWFFSYRSPWMWGVIAIAAFAVGILFWGGFNWALEATNQEAFCISCHEMRDNVFVEYRKTVHYSNKTGVRASCPDCHVPKEWSHKVVRKIQASNELYHKALGSIDTPAKFNAKRARKNRSPSNRVARPAHRSVRRCPSFSP